MIKTHEIGIDPNFEECYDLVGIGLEECYLVKHSTEVYIEKLLDNTRYNVYTKDDIREGSGQYFITSVDDEGEPLLLTLEQKESIISLL
jgi:hypothetical protein